jgi:hypothetical protein
MTEFQNIPIGFDHKTYLFFNKDLLLDENDEYGARSHYENYGYKENRNYKFNNIPDDFDSETYLKLNPDIVGNAFNAKYHYEYYGRFENRKYKKIKPIYELDEIIENFVKLYDTTYDDVISNPKIEFRFICYNSIDYIKKIKLPEIRLNNENEAVLIEYRRFPHIEFNLRTAILKLGEKWSHTIICGTFNYDFIKDIVKTISNNIKIIKTDFDNLTPSQYSKFLASQKFWNYFSGNKILIYQEDALIFKKNIEDFLQWDYIGAPWPTNSKNNKNDVGNGGLSLRSKNVMLKIINSISIEQTKINNSTIEYMKNTKSEVLPEDVYFSKNIEDLNIGKLADRYNAFKFSTESIYNENSFGGHNFWVGSNDWRKIIYKNNIISFKPHYDFSFLEHRGGWKTIIESLIQTNFYSDKSDDHFFDMIENQFLWHTDMVCENRWSGIIHCTNKTPEYLDIINIENLFNNINFIKSLKKCFLLFTLSSNVTNYIKKKLHLEYNLPIPIYTLKLPVDQNSVPLFNIEKFNLNQTKKIIQIGQQLRKVSSIYLVKSTGYEKFWLTGSKNFSKMTDILMNEIKYLNISIKQLDYSVKMHYTSTFEEYDDLLSKNIIFIDFFDTAANTAIVECIIRCTPVIVNKIGGVTEYLGEKYPLYFEKLEDVPNLLNKEKIKEAHDYLVNLNKDDLSISYFLKKINTIIYQNV